MAAPTTCTRCQASLPKPDDLGNVVCQSCGLFHHAELASHDEPAPPPPPPPAGSGGFAGPFGAPGAASPPPPPSGGGGIPGPFGAGGAATAGAGQVRQGTYGSTAGPAFATVPTGPTKRGKLGCVIVAFIVVVPIVAILGGITLAVRSVRDASRSAFTESDFVPTTGDLQVLSVDGVPTEVVAMGSRPGTTARSIALVDISGEVRWSAGIVPPDVYSAQFAVTDDVVIVSLADEVIGLDRADGAELWRTEVTDVVDPRCPDCLAVVDGVLSVLSRDAQLTAIDPASGESVWSRRLESVSSRVVPFEDQLLVIDDDPAADGAPTVFVTAPATGEVTTSFAPSCPHPSFPPESNVTVELDTRAVVEPIPGTSDIVVAFGTSASCVERWTPREAARRWSTAGELSIFLDPQVAISASDMVVATGDALVTVGLSEGTVTELPLPPDTRADGPVDLIGTTAVVSLQTSRGSTRFQLTAFDIRSRTVLWDRPFDSDEAPFPLDPNRSSETLFTGYLRYVVVPGDDELRLASFTQAGRQVAVESIDLATGRSTPVGRTAWETRFSASSSPSVRIEAVIGDRVVFTGEGIFQILDSTDATISESWAD